MGDNKSMVSPVLNIIAAICKSRGMGHQGKLPWRLKKEMKYFQEKTVTTTHPDKQNAVIMGRKTWLSIPEKFRPLPKRMNVVLSTSTREIPGAHYVASSLENAIAWLTSSEMEGKLEKLFVIGGAEVYKMALESSCDQKIYLTRIDQDFECDVFFPELDSSKYTLTSEPDVPQEVIYENEIPFKFEVYVKN